jgi:hypothetical protein
MEDVWEAERQLLVGFIDVVVKLGDVWNGLALLATATGVTLID